MRAVLAHFLRRGLRCGPFLFPLTDLHQSNIFVDDGRNVKYLIDLEWTCSLPIEVQRSPYWLTSQTVDGLADDHLTLFDRKYREFANIFAHGEAFLLTTSQERKANPCL